MAELEKVIKGLECCILRDPDDHARCSQCSYVGNCVNRLKMDALELLKALEPGWISVKDRLPDNGQDVLVYLDDGEETRVAPCNYANGVWFDCVMNCVVTLHHITHWMPLPEPPKEG